MFTKLLVVLIALPFLVSTTRTVCERYNGNTDIRCVKNGYGSDEIFIKNIAKTTISFHLTKWMSKCGKPGVDYSDQMVTLESGKQKIEPFSEASAGTCNEFFVSSCKHNGLAANCIDIVEVYPELLSTQRMVLKQ